MAAGGRQYSGRLDFSTASQGSRTIPFAYFFGQSAELPLTGFFRAGIYPGLI
jgi:hypothetical protein